MSWYAGHLVMYFKLKELPQQRFLAWENVLLIEAATEDEAFEKAERLGRAEEGDSDGSLKIDGKPATQIFAGVRKLTSCLNPEQRPGDGTEITYLELGFDSKESLDQYMEGEPVTLQACDAFPDSP